MANILFDFLQTMVPGPFGFDHPGFTQGLEENLQIDFVVGGIDSRRVINSIGINHATAHGIFDTSGLSQAEIAPFTDDLGFNL